MYSLEQFATMFSDHIRMNAYSAAIAQCVRPNDAVVDLGCGPGIFALLACKAGARRVYAIDVNSVVDFGRQLAACNGFSEKIIFMRGDSRRIHLPERVSVIVSDVRGVLPLYSHAIDTLQDARKRLLAEGGVLLPSRDILFAAVVEAPAVYEQLAGAWRAIPQLDLSRGLPLVLNTVQRQHIKPEQVISQPRACHVLDYSAATKAPAENRIDLAITKTAVGHGLGVWFQTQLTADIGYSTEPRAEETVYVHLFLPWLEPVSLREGEMCSVDLRAHLVGNDYIWQWESNLPATAEHGEIRFVQSSFYGSLFPPSVLQKRATGFVPVLDESGLAERWILQAMDGKRSLEDIATEAAGQFPHVFRRVEDAFNHAAEIAEKYSR
ncbi:MAG TPA: 50S ribosomal protein L11 methyltransferase [Candidatus Bathyarchaeia archaeon]|nr:50S ribosomal protein L11 methyltransferase [Candidatus Bathyarchaeia archaeon]